MSFDKAAESRAGETPAERSATYRAYAEEVERRAAEEGRDLDHEAEMVSAAFGIVRASTIEEQATSWLWEGFFPWGELSITEGDPDVGKTTVLLNVIAAVTTGTALPHGRSDPRKAESALYFTTEDSLSKTIVPRLKAAGADLDRVFVQTPKATAELLLPGGVENLRAIIRRTGARLVVLDPFNAFLDASEVNINREQEVRHALRPLRDLAEEKNLVVVGQRHLNKATDKPSLYRGGGSIGLAAVARSVVLIAKHPDDPNLRVMVSQKSNLAADEKKKPQGFRIQTDAAGRPRVEWLTEAPDISADELLAPKKPGPKPATKEQAKQYIRDHLAHGGKLRSDVVAGWEKTGGAVATLERAAHDLKIRSDPCGKERLWSLP